MAEHRPDPGFLDESDSGFVDAVRAAASATYERAAGQPPHLVYVVLAQELRARGVRPEPSAVYDGAFVISRGHTPAVLRTRGRRRRELPSTSR